MDGHWLYLVILLVIVLIFFGPKRLPEFGASVGKALKEFRKATSAADDVSNSVKSSFAGTPQPPVEQSYTVTGTQQQGQSDDSVPPAANTPTTSSI